MWEPPKLDTDIAYARSAEADVALLTDMFADQEVSLWGKSTQSVRCVETDVFRIFECDEHYVIVYPPNWTRRKYSIMLLPGKIPELPERNRARVFMQSGFKWDRSVERDTWLAPERLVEQRAGIDHAYLGMDIHDYSAAYENDDTVRYNDVFANYAQHGYAAFHTVSGWWYREGGGDSISPVLKHGRGQYSVVNGQLFDLSFERAGAKTLYHAQLSTHPVVIRGERVITLKTTARSDP